MVVVRQMVSRPERFLEPVSPFAEPSEHLATERPSPQNSSVCQVLLANDAFVLAPSPSVARVALDGRWLADDTELPHGSLLDFTFEYESPISVQVSTHEESPPPLPDDAVVAVARTEGAFVILGENRGRLAARLRGGPHSLRLDSLSWLKRILSSPLQARLSLLELEVWHPDHLTNWEAFTREHVELAQLAPFEVRLVPPPARRRPSLPRRAHAPQALFPLEGWKQVPLVHEDGVWVLRHSGEQTAFAETEDGLQELLPDGTPMPDPTRLFAPIRLKKARWPRTLSNFMLLPGPSAFLAGQRRLGALALTPAAVAVLADQLIEAEDVAGPLLVRASLGEPAAIATLWQPYVRGQQTLCLEGSNVCGFFEEAAVVSWVQFENDLPVLATHPMAQRLRVLRVRDEPASFTPTPERLARIRVNLETALERVKPHFAVTFMGQPIGR